MVNGQIRNIFYLTCAAVTAAVLLSLFAGLFSNLTPSFKARLKKKAATAPLFREAGKLGLTYESVLSAPMAAMGKPALWCVHLSSSQAYYEQGSARPVDIASLEEMPEELYRRNSGDYSCRKALLEITGLKTFDFEGARAVRPQARFIDYR